MSNEAKFHYTDHCQVEREISKEGLINVLSIMSGTGNTKELTKKRLLNIIYDLYWNLVYEGDVPEEQFLESLTKEELRQILR